MDQGRLTNSGHDAPAEPLTLAPFLGLVRELSALFVPLAMRPQFRAGLEESLLIAARQHIARRTLQLEPRPGYSVHLASSQGGRSGRRWVVGAAVGSAVSLASIVAIVWRYRSKAA